jgi:hypothetical protein
LVAEENVPQALAYWAELYPDVILKREICHRTLATESSSSRLADPPEGGHRRNSPSSEASPKPSSSDPPEAQNPKARREASSESTLIVESEEFKRLSDLPESISFCLNEAGEAIFQVKDPSCFHSYRNYINSVMNDHDSSKVKVSTNTIRAQSGLKNNILDFLTVNVHANAELQTWDQPTYLLLTGKGVKNIHTFSRYHHRGMSSRKYSRGSDPSSRGHRQREYRQERRPRRNQEESLVASPKVPSNKEGKQTKTCILGGPL